MFISDELSFISKPELEAAIKWFSTGAEVLPIFFVAISKKPSAAWLPATGAAVLSLRKREKLWSEVYYLFYVYAEGDNPHFGVRRNNTESFTSWHLISLRRLRSDSDLIEEAMQIVP